MKDAGDVLDTDYQSLSSLRSRLKREKITIKPQSEKETKILMICGWKPQLPEMIDFIITQYPSHMADWNKISIVANIKKENAEELIKRYNDNVAINFFPGEFVDNNLLKKAGIQKATKVVILAETESGKTFEEIDSQTVLASMMIGNLNKKAYKIAEILDKRYRESLEQANVEEIYLEDEFTRIMLANGSHGLGITQVIRKLINFEDTVLRISEIDEKYVNGSFKQLLRGSYKHEEMIVGLLEETGNIHARKSERIHLAQIQSDIRGQVQELIKVKELVPNRVVVAPEMDYKVRPNSMVISLNTTDAEGWSSYREFAL